MSGRGRDRRRGDWRKKLISLLLKKLFNMRVNVFVFQDIIYKNVFCRREIKIKNKFIFRIFLK